MNQDKAVIVAKRKVQALFRNKQKYKYDNYVEVPNQKKKLFKNVSYLI